MYCYTSCCTLLVYMSKMGSTWYFCDLHLKKLAPSYYVVPWFETETSRSTFWVAVTHQTHLACYSSLTYYCVSWLCTPCGVFKVIVIMVILSQAHPSILRLTHGIYLAFDDDCSWSDNGIMAKQWGLCDGTKDSNFVLICMYYELAIGESMMSDNIWCWIFPHNSGRVG